MSRVKEYVREHLLENLRVDSVARSLYLSQSHLAHTFRAVEKQGLREFIQQERVTLVKDLLHDSSLWITEIAEKAGFSSIHHLSRTFRAKTGFSPTGYARSLQP